MAGKLERSDESYSHFDMGANDHNAPLSAIDKKMLAFATRMAEQPALKTHGQILRNFGMYPPEFWTRVQALSSHPELSQREKTKLSYIFPDPSRPGPMGGGIPATTDGKSYSHGVQW